MESKTESLDEQKPKFDYAYYERLYNKLFPEEESDDD